jgi:mono/diheme cytochrome c family protein
MRRLLLAASCATLAMAAGAQADVRIVNSEQPDDWTGGAIGLAVPGAGPTVTRAAAVRTLLTGKVGSSLLGGPPAGPEKIRLGVGTPPTILVTLPPAGVTRNTKRYPIVLLDGSRGVLTSDSTRIVGLVSLADVANDKLRTVAAADPAGVLARLDGRINRNSRIRLPLTIVLAATAIFAAVFAPRYAPRVFLVALAANLWLMGWWLVAVLVGIVLFAPIGLACLALLAAYLAVLGLDPETVALSPFGPSQAGRFYGVSNLVETMLLVPALLGAARLGRLGVVAGAVALVLVGGNRFGADGGGLLVLLAGYSVLLLRLRGTHLSPRLLAGLSVGVVAIGLGLVGLDAALGASSHVTNVVGDGPLGLLQAIGDRLELSARRTVSGWGPAFVVSSGLVGLAVVATRRQRGAVTDALLVALAVSLIVNDTPEDVVGVGVAAAFAIWRWENRTSRGRPVTLDTLRAMRRSTTALAASSLLAAIALVVAGCGGGEEVEATPETVIGDVPTETSGGTADLPALALTGDATAGKDVFASQGCGACHTLSAAGASGNVGPNLDDAKPARELVITRVTLGQGGMPKFGDKLKAQQIADVAAYVVESTSG